jgi:CBS domain containing-hemolysin-like protein
VIAVSWTVSDTALLISVAILLIFSGFFALAETSLVRTSKSRARSLRDQGLRGSAALADLAEDPDSFLNPLLLLVLICQLVSATLVGVLAGRIFGAAGVLIATVAEVVVIFVVFEAIPKNFAVQHLDQSALIAAPVVSRILKFWPVRWIAALLLSISHAAIRLLGGASESQRMTDAEIMAMADVAHEENSIAVEERDFIHSVIEFGDTIVREVMVPRIDMVSVASDETVAVAFERAVETGRSRLPVLGEGVDDVLGVVNLRYLAKLIAEGRSDEHVGNHFLDVFFVPETKKVASLLAEFKKEKSHLFIVIDEFGGTAGLITLEDVLEELVGEIADESDDEVVDEDDDKKTADGVVTISGRLNIDDVNDEYDLALPKDGWDTVGGLVLDLAGGVPVVGQHFDADEYRLTVVRMDGRRIEEVRIEPLRHA